MSRQDPARVATAVTPNDSNDLTGGSTNAIYVGVTGNVALLTKNATQSVIFSNVQSGTVLPVQAQRILSTGTTASGIVALYD